ncbi:hypothetical protein M433DRAFT_75250, partial [Acidomyces richmondensis BFW]
PLNKLNAITIACGMGIAGMSKRSRRWTNWAGLTFGQLFLPKPTRVYFASDSASQSKRSKEQHFERVRRRCASPNSNDGELAV